MIPVPRPNEPATFNLRCRQPGNRWLAANPASRKFPGYWRQFQPDVEDGFSRRCGWWAVRITDGPVEHYLSRENHRNLAYEWTNYRYSSGSVNSSKGKLDDAVLDPFEVQAGWFEVILPSMQLIATAQVPAHLRAKAAFTIEKLKLDNGPKIRKTRRGYYEDFKANRLTYEGLLDYAPLVAEAVQRWQQTGRPLP